ncbi:DUF3106 domain-containing protein [Massilia sp. PWRC2]|uniref:DUF3106 domain-containing protein n=1 Tax=Massilia sp. PWRC2 TaxID=2804626 RepID=UPI003CE69DB2
MVRLACLCGAALLALAGVVLAQTGTAVAPALAPATAPAVPRAIAPAAAPAAKGAVNLVKPAWASLSAAQKVALEPLAAEWDRMEAIRKQKWLDIANRFASMKPDEQARVHEKMREWVRMTPGERRLVRENYTRAQKLDVTQKSAQWEKYQQLPEEQKQKLAEEAAKRKKQLTNLPTPTQASVKTVAPILRNPQPPCPAGSARAAAPAGGSAVAACVAVSPPALVPAAAAAAAPAPALPPGPAVNGR